jgi:hypothetical protein
LNLIIPTIIFVERFREWSQIGRQRNMLSKEQIERDLIIAHEMNIALKGKDTEFYSGKVSALKNVLELTDIGLAVLLNNGV